MQLQKEESGVLTVEATIVVTISIMVVFFLINVTLAVYQKGNVSATANQAATDIANTYGFSKVEPFVGYVGLDDFSTRKLYRYLGTLGSTSLDAKQKAKAKWYACYLLESNEIFIHPGMTGSHAGDVKVDVTKSRFGTRQISVKIKREYPVLAVNPMKILGLDPKITCTAEGYAECYDMIDYINSESFKGEIKTRVAGNSLIESICGVIESFITMLETAYK